LRRSFGFLRNVFNRRFFIFWASKPWFWARCLLGLGLCGGCFDVATAQTSNLRTRRVTATNPTHVLDTLSILPPLAVTDATTGAVLDARFFSLKNNTLHLDTAALRAACAACSTLQVTYRVLPFDLARPVRRLDTLAIRRAGSGTDIAFDYTPFEQSRPLLAQPGLQSSGTYTRGLSVGNSQNLVFNSNLNLQFEGKLGDDLRIRGALSDNSIPLQADGTTRQLQEFDRIFIELQRRNTTLAAGDLDLARPANGYFSNYFKRVQGARVSVTVPQGKSPQSASVVVGGGISRGKFARQIVAGQEGNQGPYRLVGAEGERFIIVLSGTERVYADGQLLQRGATDDYVIDYNLGEVTFTPKRLITKDIRIIVEFEYAVQNFLRSTAMSQAEWPLRGGKVWLNLYTEQDGRSPSGGQELSANERARLAQAGDSLRTAFASGVDTLAEFDATRVLYRWADTVACNGQVLPILVFSTSSELARLAVRFSEVPMGQGNYVQAPNGANGRVFRWVAPDPATCQPRGNYEPIVRLIAPEQRQLHTVGIDYQFFKKTKVWAEAALSQRDLNRLSPLADGDNLGGAGVVRVRHAFFDPKKNAAWVAEAYADYEHTTRDFRFLNPYRPPEFVRDWNTDAGSTIGAATPPSAAEHLGKGGFFLENKKYGATGRYEWGGFVREGQYEGQRHTANARWRRNGWEAMAEINELRTEGAVETTRFWRPKAEVARSFFFQKKQPQLRVGVYAEREKNARRSVAADTLLRTGLWYDMAKLYVQMPDNQRRVQAGGYLSQRNDYLPTGQRFAQNTAATDANLNGSWANTPTSAQARKPATTQQLIWNLTWRQLRVVAPELTTLESQQTYLGRVDYNFSALNNGLAFTTGYELGSGQTPKVEFNYLQVNPGEGQYTWVDRNRDSILQVDEMETAVFQDQASYVRVALTTTEYQRTNNVQMNQNLRLEPRMWWPQARKGPRGVAARLALQSTWQVNRRVLTGVSGASAWNPLDLAVADSALVTVNVTSRNVLFLNRAQPRWDLSLAQQDNRSRLLVTTGFESRRLADWTLHGRLNANPRWSLEGDVVVGQKVNDSENFGNRDYDLALWELGPKATWLPRRTFRMVSRVVYKNRQNRLESGEKSTQTDYSAELTWNPQARLQGGFRAATSLRARLTLADIRYSGAPNTPVAFAMLEGLQDGRNLLWGLTLDRQLSRSMQLNLSYEGRRTGTAARVVHVARAQVRAVF
jgi:hypothetical protein